MTNGRESELQVGVLRAGAGPGELGDDWMTRLLRTPVFQTIPPVDLQKMFQRMQQISVPAGQVVIRQGESGDYFYVIEEGRCVVTRESAGQPPLRLAELDVGQCFGEEALLSDDPRNATVMMLTPGRLMRLSKLEFRSLLREPMARRLSYAEAAQRVERGEARWLDVRVPTEFKNGHLPGAINVPLMLLRRKLGQLDHKTNWIVVCEDGRASSVGLFVLRQWDFEAWQLESGISNRA